MLKRVLKKIGMKNKRKYVSFDDACWENTKPFVPNVSYGKVIKCYDVDTCTVVAKPYKEEPICRFTIRLYGIDGPELRSKDPIEKEVAYIAKTRLCEKILNKYVTIQAKGTDKYGRLLCEIWLNNESINTWLLEQRLVVCYDGGRKNSPDNWRMYMENTE